jgi:hypothetical protein
MVCESTVGPEIDMPKAGCGAIWVLTFKSTAQCRSCVVPSLSSMLNNLVLLIALDSQLLSTRRHCGDSGDRTVLLTIDGNRQAMTVSGFVEMLRSDRFLPSKVLLECPRFCNAQRLAMRLSGYGSHMNGKAARAAHNGWLLERQFACLLHGNPFMEYKR